MVMAEVDYFSLSESTLKELADKGDIQANLVLGMNYYYSAYGECNINTAYNYLLYAYNNGEKMAAPFLGEMIYFRQVRIAGFNTDTDYFKMAHSLFKEAKELDMVAGWRALAKMMIRGDYLQQDLSTAYYYLDNVKDKDEECAYLVGLFQNHTVSPDKIRPNVEFGKEEVQECPEPDDVEEQFYWEGMSDDEMVARWLGINTPQEDGFDLPLTLEEIMEDMDWDISLDIDCSKMRWYDDFYGETVKDLLVNVIKSDDEAVEMLVELSRIYRTMAGWELNKAAYWAHKAVILAAKGARTGALDYYADRELFCGAFGALADAYFSYPCSEEDTRWFPNLKLAAKYYKEAAAADFCNEYDFNIMAGRAYSALGLKSCAEEMFFKQGFDRSKGQAWLGQMYFVKGWVKPAIEQWKASMEGNSGWGEYFLGRYYWGQKYYTTAIDLWQQGEKKGCGECTGELFNWLVGHPDTSPEEKHNQWNKAMALYGTGKCTSVYKYIEKHIMNGNLVFSDVQEGRMMASAAIYKGLKEFCPYCAKIYKEKFNFADAGLAMTAWGYDGNIY